MQIILKVKTQFFERIKTGIAKDVDGNLVDVLAVKNTVVVSPSQKPQVVPDWIDSDPIFALMVKDGSLVQIPAATQAEALTDTASAETATQDSSKKGRK